ncbi:serine-rich coiled-coil domain-containing protein 2 [Callorhinchus milii]|uniref:serine-rich coiled-coil domain-containing protein 2 n=1 Tax=Callorhinchus milii TaxID=7868 RepID=UPI001C3FE78F|nr:serine-rich coiled-coil domain-containing protein 2 [Callorhinchus milii]
MEEKAQSKLCSGSRLPKFGGGGTKLTSLPQPVPNGTCVHTVSTSNSSKPSSKQNGIGRASAFSFNWKMSGKTKLDERETEDSSSSFPNKTANVDFVEVEKNSKDVKDHTNLGFKSKSTAASKGLKQKQIVSYVEGSKNLVADLNHYAKGKGKIPGKSITPSNSKSHSFGHFYKRTIVKAPEKRETFSGSSSSRDSLTQSTESLKNLADENIVRSQSFSYSMPSNSSISVGIPRSLSFSKAADVSGTCLQQQIRKSLPLKPKVLSYGNVRGTDSSSTGELAFQDTSNRSCLKAPSSAFKRPQLPSCSTSLFSTSSSAYKTTRSSLIKPSRLPSSGRGNPISGTIEEIPGISKFENASTHENGNNENTTDHQLAIVNTTDEKSLPEESESSSKKDIDDLVVLTSLTGSRSNQNNKSEPFLHSGIGEIADSGDSISIEISDNLQKPNEFITSEGADETLVCGNTDTEWLETSLSDQCKDLENFQTTGSSNDLVSQDDNCPLGSSSELSPSSSSAGTYLWDEEGMEPIGTVEQCGSLESSELNSLDILNNLDSCDLDEDDLMLDIDLPEDFPCKMEACDSMTHLDRSERGSRNQGFWRKRYPCWSGQEHYHHGNNELQRSPVGQESTVSNFEWHGSSNYFRASNSHPRAHQPGAVQENTVMLDVMTLRHMVHDCTSVKTQILKLKRLLQQNDDGTPIHDLIPVISPTQEPSEAMDPAEKTEELLNEIKELQEEMKRKDEMITQLQQKLSIKCNCQKESHDIKGVAASCVDKTTQTAHKGTHPPVLQPSSHILSSRDIHAEKVAKTVHIEDPSRCTEQASYENCQTNQNAKVTDSPQMDSDKLSFLLTTQLKIEDSDDKLPKSKVHNTARQSLNILPNFSSKEHGPNQASLQQICIAGPLEFAEETINKDYQPKFSFKPCQPSKDLNFTSQNRSSRLQSPSSLKARKNAAPVTQTGPLPTKCPVQPTGHAPKEKGHQSQLKIPLNLSNQNNEQKRTSKLPPSLYLSLLKTKTAESSIESGSPIREIQHAEATGHQNEPHFQFLPINKPQKPQSSRNDRPGKQRESQIEKIATSIRYSRLPKPKMHVSKPSNYSF